MNLTRLRYNFNSERVELNNVTPDDACSSNPCKGDCRCELSCKHEDGYMCISPSGLLGKNCDIRKMCLLYCCDIEPSLIPYTFFQQLLQ